jgi:hypothetical protein
VCGGRPGIRSILYVVAEIVRRYDPDFVACRHRLVAGRPKMVIRVALARKLLVRLNAKARDTRRQLATPRLTFHTVAHPSPLPASGARETNFAGRGGYSRT